MSFINLLLQNIYLLIWNIHLMYFFNLQEAVGEAKVATVEGQCEEILVTTELLHIIQVAVIFIV